MHIVSASEFDHAVNAFSCFGYGIFGKSYFLAALALAAVEDINKCCYFHVRTYKVDRKGIEFLVGAHMEDEGMPNGEKLAPTNFIMPVVEPI